MAVVDLVRSLKHRGFVARKTMRRDLRWLGAYWDPDRRREQRGTAARLCVPGLTVAPRRPGSVWGVTVVRNEQDVIAATVRHLLQQGVDGVIVVDNMSTDDTLQIVRTLAEEDPRIVVGTDTDPAHRHAAKINHLASLAARAGADWIVPFDADEWWYGVSRPLAEQLKACPSPIAVAVVHNAFPHARGYRLDRQPARLQKVAYRWHPWAVVVHGNHSVHRPGQPVEVLRVLHIPWRSWEQFSGKLRHGAAALNLADQRETAGGDHWRDLGTATDATLRGAWQDVIDGRTNELTEWTPRGELVPIEVDAWGQWDPQGILS